jgi:hypothetical protein
MRLRRSGVGTNPDPPPAPTTPLADQADQVSPASLKQHAELTAYVRRVEALPGVGEYLQERPPVQSQQGEPQGEPSPAA